MRVHSYTEQEPHWLEEHNKWIPLYFWSGLLVLLGGAGIVNLLSEIHSKRRRRLAGHYALTKQRAIKGCSRTNKRCSRWVPAFLLSIVRKYGIKKSRIADLLHVSNLGEAGLIAAHTAFVLALAFSGAANDISWQAHHCARLVSAQLPLVIGLASKNNLISYLTGYSYESLNVFHRTSARLIVLLTIVHVGGRIYVNEPSVNPHGRGQAYIVYGIIAFAAFLFMALGSARPFRNAQYTFFIITHVASLLVIFVSLWIHRPQMANWVAAGIAVYFLDRIWRTARIILYHYIRTLPKTQASTAYVEALSSDTVRVVVCTKQSWTPGAHVYLHCPSISAGGHPFSVSSISRPLTQLDNKRPEEAQQELLIRVRNGVTKKLYELAVGTQADAESQKGLKWPRANLPLCWTEGPYGNLQHLGEEFQTVLLVAGGSGLTFTLPIMLDIVRRAHSMDLGHADVAVATERLVFVWIIRDIEQIEWIRPQLEEALLLAPQDFLDVQIYCTRLSSDKEGPAVSLSGAKIISGRPDFPALIEENILASDFTDWSSVSVCGPGKMSADLADAVSNAIHPSQVLKGEHRRNIYFHQEQFGW